MQGRIRNEAARPTLGRILVNEILGKPTRQNEQRNPAEIRHDALNTLKELLGNLSRREQLRFLIKAQHVFRFGFSDIAQGEMKELVVQIEADPKEEQPLVTLPNKRLFKEKLAAAYELFFEFLAAHKEISGAHDEKAHDEKVLGESPQRWAMLIRQVCKVPHEDPGIGENFQGNIFNKPLINDGSDDFEAEEKGGNELERSTKITGDMANYRFVAHKASEGGAQAPGKHGCFAVGVGRDKNGKLVLQKMLFKQEIKSGNIQHDRVIAEYVAGGNKSEYLGNNAASIILATRPGADAKDLKAEDIYAGSLIYKNAKKLFEVLWAIAHPDPNQPCPVGKNEVEWAIAHPDPNRPCPKERDKFLKQRILPIDPLDPDSNVREFRQALLKLIGYPNRLNHDLITQLTRAIASGFREKDSDFHAENIMVIFDDEGHIVDVVVIDHGAAHRNLTDKIHPHQSNILRDQRLWNPANNFLVYPPEFKETRAFNKVLGEEFGDLRRKTITSLFAGIDARIDRVAELYGKNSAELRKYAKEMGVKNFSGDIAENIKAFLKQKEITRTVDSIKVSLEYKLSASIKKTGTRFNWTPRVNLRSNWTVEELAVQHPFYFFHGDYHFRGTHQDDRDTLLTPFVKHKATIAIVEKLNSNPLAKILKKDFVMFMCNLPEGNNFKYDLIQDAARVYLFRLGILAQNAELISRSVNLKDSLIHQIEMMERIVRSDTPSKTQLALMCDHAYQIITKIYDKAPAITKKLLETLMTVPGNFNRHSLEDRAAYIRTLKSKVKPITRAEHPVIQVLDANEAAIESSASLDVLKETSTRLANLENKIAEEEGTIDKAAVLADIEKLTKKIEQRKLEIEEKQKEIKSTDQKILMTSLSESIPLEVKEGQTVTQAAFEKFPSLMGQESEGTQPISTAVGISAVVGKKPKVNLIIGTKADFMPNAADPKNKDSQNPVSGVVVTRTFKTKNQESKVTCVELSEVAVSEDFKIEREIAIKLVNAGILRLKGPIQNLDQLERIIKNSLNLGKPITFKTAQELQQKIKDHEDLEWFFRNKDREIFQILKETAANTLSHDYAALPPPKIYEYAMKNFVFPAEPGLRAEKPLSGQSFLSSPISYDASFIRIEGPPNPLLTRSILLAAAVRYHFDAAMLKKAKINCVVSITDADISQAKISYPAMGYLQDDREAVQATQHLLGG